MQGFARKRPHHNNEDVAENLNVEIHGNFLEEGERKNKKNLQERRCVGTMRMTETNIKKRQTGSHSASKKGGVWKYSVFLRKTML